MKKYLVIICFSFLFCISQVFAEETFTYRIKIIDNGTNLRYDAGGSNGNYIARMSAGDYYTLVDDKLYDDVNNHKHCNGNWYYMQYNSETTGYVCSDNAEVIVSHSTDDVLPVTDCEKELAEAGFPSSYWGGLCKLKESHPTWIFKSVNLNLDWKNAVEEESSCGHNYIINTIKDSSFFDTTCTSTSPGGYVAPSQTAVAYYMDPRNSFTEKYLFQFLDQSYDANLGEYYSNAVETIIKDAEFYKYHLSIGNNLKDIIIASSVDKASPIAIASKMRVELGVGTSLENLYSGIYEGYEKIYLDYYNFFNFGVTDSCVAANGTTYCGLNYAFRSGWKGLSVAISGGISQFADGYILKEQYTGYFQKFNVASTNENSLFMHQYMTNLAGAKSESQTSYNSYAANNLLELNLVFKIPVYKNMDAMITNSNNGAVGDNETEVKPSTIPISTIVTSSGYNYSSKYISKISAGTDVSTVKGAIESVGGNATVNIMDKDGNIVSSGLIGTGFKVSINNQSSTEVLEVIVKGDTSGDGVINALDLLQVQKNILGTYTLSGSYLEAADTSKDGTVNALDLLQIQKNILGLYNIEE